MTRQEATQTTSGIFNLLCKFDLKDQMMVIEGIHDALSEMRGVEKREWVDK